MQSENFRKREALADPSRSSLGPGASRGEAGQVWLALVRHGRSTGAGSGMGPGRPGRVLFFAVAKGGWVVCFVFNFFLLLLLDVAFCSFRKKKAWACLKRSKPSKKAKKKQKIKVSTKQE